jgi:hypothetical protein
MARLGQQSESMRLDLVYLGSIALQGRAKPVYGKAR